MKPGFSGDSFNRGDTGKRSESAVKIAEARLSGTPLFLLPAFYGEHRAYGSRFYGAT
jgi:hypothetical protein